MVACRRPRSLPTHGRLLRSRATRTPAPASSIVADSVLDADQPGRQPSGVVAIAHARRRRAWTRCLAEPAGAGARARGRAGPRQRRRDRPRRRGRAAPPASSARTATADPFGWKALRGAMGGTFRLPVAAGGATRGRGRRSRRAGLAVAGDGAARRHAAAARDLRQPCAVLLGAEGAGLSPDAVATRPTHRSRIPMRRTGRIAQRRGRRRADPVRSRAAAGGPLMSSVRRSGARPHAGNPISAAPLAERMRPRTLDEFVGQDALLAPGRPLREAIEHDRLRSIILWGPPGTGKTTLARLIAGATRAHFIAFSAVLSGIKEIREVMAEAEAGAPPARPPHHPLRRRDPPLQQGAAGRLPAPRRSRRHRPHRRDDREPVVRGELGAALALEGLRPEAARARTAVVTILRRALADPERGLGDAGVTATTRRSRRSRATRTATRGSR